MTEQIFFHGGSPEQIIKMPRVIAEIARLYEVQVKATAGYDFGQDRVRPICIHFEVSGEDEAVRSFRADAERKQPDVLFQVCPKGVHKEPDLEARIIATLNDGIEEITKE